MRQINLFLIIVVLFVAVLVSGCVGVTDNSSTVNSVSVDNQVEKDNSEKTATKKNVEKSKVEVISHKVKNERAGYSAIVGEVKNTGNIPVSFVKVTVTYYDKNNEVTDTDFVYAGDTAEVALQPGKTAPFKVIVDNGVTKFDHYKLDVTWEDEEDELE